MKFCGFCGESLQDEWAQCPRCGAPSDIPEDVEMPPVKPKRRVWLLVLSIVLSVTLVFGSIVPLSVWWFARQNTQSTQTNATTATKQAALTVVDDEQNESENEQPPIDDGKPAYTQGVVQNGVYVNEWLGITFDLSRSFPQYDANDQSAYESGYNDCGYASITPDGEHQLVLLFEDMTRSVSGYKNAAECIEQAYEEAVEAYDRSSVRKPTTRRIAGRVYRLLRIEIDDMVQYVAVADVDNRLVMFIAFSSDENRILRAFDAMETLS